jgi:hypothetical protein
MRYGNTNISAQPYAPTDYSKQPSGQNPYGFGYQRVAGQVAPQAPAQGYNANFMAGAQVGRPQRQFGYGPQPAPQTSVPPQMPGDVSYQPMPNPTMPVAATQPAWAYAGARSAAGDPAAYFTGGNYAHNFDQFAQPRPPQPPRYGY